jgi:hypothetical protein
MIIGIVGSEGAKFTPETEAAAKQLIHTLLIRDDVWGLTSGHCHLGGVDIWAEEECQHLQGVGIPLRDDNFYGYKPDLEMFIYAPKVLNWSQGYKPRNIQIAKKCDELHNITVKKLPSDFKGMRFPSCYHCGVDTHTKSGGCWTAKYAQKLGKPAFWHVI